VLDAARAGAPWAFERLYTQLAPAVAGYLRMQRAREPEDLTSEVFLGVFRGLRAFHGDEPQFRSWVFTIAHRRLLDERRRLRRRPPPEPLADAPDAPARDDVESTVAQRLEGRRLRELCQQLGADQRDVLLLRFLGGLTVDEVAVALGKTCGAVKGLQRRAFLGLARLVEREDAPL
jgi:RNA polymerase sigma-70 factor, ECF subfamily